LRGVREGCGGLEATVEERTDAFDFLFDRGIDCVDDAGTSGVELVLSDVLKDYRGECQVYLLLSICSNSLGWLENPLILVLLGEAKCIVKGCNAIPVLKNRDLQGHVWLNGADRELRPSFGNLEELLRKICGLDLIISLLGVTGTECQHMEDAMALREDIEAKLAGSLVIDVFQVEVGIALDLLRHKPIEICEGGSLSKRVTLSQG